MMHPSTLIRVQTLANKLFSQLDPIFADFLILGLSQGFRVDVFSDVSYSYVCGNLQLAIKEPSSVATRKFSGKKRPVFDLLAPHRGPVPCVNDLIPAFSLHYATANHAIRTKITGQGIWLSEADITVQTCPNSSHWHLFSVK